MRQDALYALTAWKDATSLPDIVPLLSHDRQYVRLLAVRALEAAGSREAIAAVAGRLQDSGLDVRVAAAECLCTLGSRDGVPTLLKEGKNFTALNLLRRPEAWKDLGSRPFTRVLSGRRSELLQLLCREARLELREPRRCCDLEELNHWEGCGTSVDAHGKTMLSAMQEALSSDPYEMVLEPDRLVILTHEEARGFWTTWWNEESKRK